MGIQVIIAGAIALLAVVFVILRRAQRDGNGPTPDDRRRRARGSVGGAVAALVAIFAGASASMRDRAPSDAATAAPAANGPWMGIAIAIGAIALAGLVVLLVKSNNKRS